MLTKVPRRQSLVPQRCSAATAPAQSKAVSVSEHLQHLVTTFKRFRSWTCFLPETPVPVLPTVLLGVRPDTILHAHALRVAGTTCAGLRTQLQLSRLPQYVLCTCKRVLVESCLAYVTAGLSYMPRSASAETVCSSDGSLLQRTWRSMLQQVLSSSQVSAAVANRHHQHLSQSNQLNHNCTPVKLLPLHGA